MSCDKGGGPDSPLAPESFNKWHGAGAVVVSPTPSLSTPTFHVGGGGFSFPHPHTVSVKNSMIYLYHMRGTTKFIDYIPLRSRGLGLWGRRDLCRLTRLPVPWVGECRWCRKGKMDGCMWPPGHGWWIVHQCGVNGNGTSFHAAPPSHHHNKLLWWIILKGARWMCHWEVSMQITCSKYTIYILLYLTYLAKSQQAGFPWLN